MVGHIDAAKIAAYCAPPSAQTRVFVCGVPAMYESLCGARAEKGVAPGSVLHGLKYTEEMVVKF